MAISEWDAMRNKIHRKDKQKEGLQKEHKHVNVTELNITKVINFGHLEEMNLELSEIEKLMCEDLAHRIIKSNLIRIKTKTSYLSKEKTLTAHINIVEAGVKFASVVDDVFVIGTEKFSNEELIEAVKAHFPERLV